jgi:hypothetical protein
MLKSLRLSQHELEKFRAAFGPEAAADCGENRTSGRSHFPAIQMLGPCGDWGLPQRHMFFEVRCCDLSQGGISFFLTRAPTFEFAVIGLGKEPNISYFLIQPKHFREHGEDRNQYLVGCKFLGRVRCP